MALTEKRRMEMAEQMLVEVIFDDGLNLSSGMKREVCNKAQRLGIRQDEMLEFAAHMITKVSERAIRSLTEQKEAKKKRTRKFRG